MARTTMLAAETTFGELLRHLRRCAGMTQSQLALLVDFSTAQISRLEKDDRLPDLALLAEKFLPALGLENEPHLAQQLLTLAAAARGERPPVLAINQPAIKATIEKGALLDDAYLPAPPTPLIGRKDDVTMIVDRLWSAPGRLLTLLGPPGVGKTQLALAVGTKMRHLFFAGVYFVPLVTVVDAAQVPSALMNTLGVTAASRRTPQSQLIEHLRCKESLLILDNFEQIIEAAALIATLLSECPAVRILVTSQQPLRLRAEQRFKVAPLAPAAAVELFFQRAQAIDFSFATDSAQAAIVTAICLRLDCLPLAIELVAPQIEIFSLPQLLARLQDRSLDLLADGPRDLLGHHQTLRNAIHRSYALLPPDEQQLLQTMAVFAGGCTQELLLSFADQTTPKVDHPLGWLPALQALVRKSLVQQTLGAGGARFTLLSTLRDYALEQLSANAELVNLRSAHAHHFLILAKQAAERMRSSEQQLWLERLGEEHDNLRVALQWMLEQHSPLALTMVVAMAEFWATRGYDFEARARINQVLADHPTATIERAAVLMLAANFARRQADYCVAERYTDESMAIYRAQGDDAGLAEALRQDGWLQYDLHHSTAAVERFQASLAYHRRTANRAGIADLLLGLVHVLRPFPEHANTVRTYLAESLALYRKLEEPTGIAQALQQQGEIELSAGHYAMAAARFHENLAIWRAQGAKLNMAWSLALIGEAAWLQQDLATAAASYAEAYALFIELGNKDGSAILLHHIGQVAGCQGDLPRAEEAYQESITLSYALQNRHMMARGAAGLAATAFAQGNHGRAIMLMGAAQQLLEQLPAFLAPADEAAYQSLWAAIGTLQAADEATFVQCSQQGRALTLAELMTYATNRAHIGVS